MATGSRGPGRATGPAWSTGPARPRTPTAHELEVYKQLATLFNSEETSFWTRNNILVALQGALVTAFATILVKTIDLKRPSDDLLHLFEAGCIAVCAIGLFLAVAWLFMVRRSTYISRTIADQLEAIEKDWQPRCRIRPSFNAYTAWNRSLEFDRTEREALDKRKRRASRIFFLRGRPFAGWRLSDIWTSLGALFVVVWLALLWIVLVKGPLLPGNGKGGDDDGKPPPSAGAGLYAVTRFDGFLPGEASLPCGSPAPASRPLADTLAAIEQARSDKLGSLVLLIGATDRTALTPEHRKQYESNSGLAQARAARVRDCIAGELASSVMDDRSVHFVTLDAGPGYTPLARDASAKTEHPDQARDRSVQVLVLGLPGRTR
jgi:hypothetical protein